MRVDNLKRDTELPRDLLSRGRPLRSSPSQSRIAQHVEAVADNREVAARPYLGVRTVDHHPRNVYSESGIWSRVELSRIVGR